VAKGLPVNRRNPALFGVVELHNPIGKQFIRPPLGVGIVGVQRQREPLVQFDAMPLQIAVCAGAGKAQAILIVKVLEIRINAGWDHCLAPARLSGLGF
jgi:hypothetical protein